jgi:hypothetical protein
MLCELQRLGGKEKERVDMQTVSTAGFGETPWDRSRDRGSVSDCAPWLAVNSVCARCVLRTYSTIYTVRLR